MFYSHQLLARKAPLGQIWMAATMHQKINRRNLDKLNIIKICEEILNPSVPMALRLSGILMGGVVIVYERKVKVLYDDVTRLLVEINQAWKVKAVPDPTVLPKGKSQAKYEAVTLPENQEAELGEAEQSLQYTESATMVGFQQTSYITMRLDNVDEPLINHNFREEEDQSHHYHQADTANITLSENFDTYQADTNFLNRFERFDNEGDEETTTHVNLTPQDQTEIPSTLIPSPVIQQDPQKSDEIQEPHPEDHKNQQSDEGKEANQPQQAPQRQGPPQKRARRAHISIMDYEQTIIPGHIFQSWLQDTSDLVSRRGRKIKHIGTMPSMKIPNLMELPSVVLMDGLFEYGTGEIHYPPPLLKLSMTSVQPPDSSCAGRAPPPQPSSSSSPPERTHYEDPVGFAFKEIHNGVGSRSREKQRTTFTKDKMSAENLAEELKHNSMNKTVTDTNGIVTPGNSGNDIKSMPSSGSGQGLVSNNSEVNSGRSKKRHYSSSHGGSGGLEPVLEENSWHNRQDPDFHLDPLSENDLAPENGLLVETGPTQTQKNPFVNQQPIDQITDSIRTQLKMHFDTPEFPQVVSLDQMAIGMNKKRAACLFYQTCILATREFARVEQKMPYGDILISRGAKM